MIALDQQLRRQRGRLNALRVGEPSDGGVGDLLAWDAGDVALSHLGVLGELPLPDGEVLAVRRHEPVDRVDLLLERDQFREERHAEEPAGDLEPVEERVRVPAPLVLLVPRPRGSLPDETVARDDQRPALRKLHGGADVDDVEEQLAGRVAAGGVEGLGGEPAAVLVVLRGLDDVLELGPPVEGVLRRVLDDERVAQLFRVFVDEPVLVGAEEGLDHPVDVLERPPRDPLHLRRLRRGGVHGDVERGPDAPLEILARDGLEAVLDLAENRRLLAVLVREGVGLLARPGDCDDVGNVRVAVLHFADRGSADHGDHRGLGVQLRHVERLLVDEVEDDLGQLRGVHVLGLVRVRLDAVRGPIRGEHSDHGLDGADQEVVGALGDEGVEAAAAGSVAEGVDPEAGVCVVVEPREVVP